MNIFFHQLLSTLKSSILQNILKWRILGDDYWAIRRNKIVLYWNPINLVFKSMGLMGKRDQNYILNLMWYFPWSTRKDTILCPHLLNEVLWCLKYMRNRHKELTGATNWIVVGKTSCKYFGDLLFVLFVFFVVFICLCWIYFFFFNIISFLRRISWLFFLS